MNQTAAAWDYLIVTASNETQGRAYEAQLRLRQELGLLPQVREAFVVADLEGRRIGSGGSTIYCIAKVLERESSRRPGDVTKARTVEEILRRLRILIVHAGGDSRRLPAYGPCGKIFVPVPGESGNGLPVTLFDRLVPGFLDLPAGTPGRGQIVVAAGDALVRFNASSLSFPHPGITVLGCYATPEEASHHGVFCLGADDSITLYLQKPPVAEQEAAGAITGPGKSVLDIGVMSFDAEAAAVLLTTFGVAPTGNGRFSFESAARERILAHGVDLYREICCAMGSAATFEHYVRSARSSGSSWSEQMLAGVYPSLRAIPFYVKLLPYFGFLHFGSTRQLVESGLALVAQDRGTASSVTSLSVNNAIAEGASITGPDSWVEGCRVSAPLQMDGQNVVVGVDVDAPLWLPREACLDVLFGRSRHGAGVWFVRCYGVRDTFKDSIRKGGLFCSRPLLEWAAAAGIDPGEIWPEVQDPADRSLWNARVFPAERAAGGFRRWLWMYSPETATAEEKQAFLSADRYSAAAIAVLTEQEAFHMRRVGIWAEESRRSRGSSLSGAGRSASTGQASSAATSSHGVSWVDQVLATAESCFGKSRKVSS